MSWHSVTDRRQDNCRDRILHEDSWSPNYESITYPKGVNALHYGVTVLYMSATMGIKDLDFPECSWLEEIYTDADASPCLKASFIWSRWVEYLLTAWKNGSALVFCGVKIVGWQHHCRLRNMTVHAKWQQRTKPILIFFHVTDCECVFFFSLPSDCCLFSRMHTY